MHFVIVWNCIVNISCLYSLQSHLAYNIKTRQNIISVLISTFTLGVTLLELKHVFTAKTKSAKTRLESWIKVNILVLF